LGFADVDAVALGWVGAADATGSGPWFTIVPSFGKTWLVDGVEIEGPELSIPYRISEGKLFISAFCLFRGTTVFDDAAM
jgi:hypothetical protein